MTIPNRDEIGGKIDQAKGDVKERVGRATGDADLEAEGVADKAAGDVKEGFGKLRRKAGDAIEDVADALRKP